MVQEANLKLLSSKELAADERKRLLRLVFGNRDSVQIKAKTNKVTVDIRDHVVRVEFTITQTKQTQALTSSMAFPYMQFLGIDDVRSLCTRTVVKEKTHTHAFDLRLDNFSLERIAYRVFHPVGLQQVDAEVISR